MNFGGVAARAGLDQGDCCARPRELDRQCAAGGAGANYADIELVLDRGCGTSMVRGSEWPRQPSECVVDGPVSGCSVFDGWDPSVSEESELAEPRAQHNVGPEAGAARQEARATSGRLVPPVCRM